MTSTIKSSGGGLTFAGIMFIVLGGFNLIDGFVLLQHASWVESTKFLTSNADTWGWILVVWGVLQLVAGVKLLNSGTGRGLALTLACIGMFMWFLLLFVFPFASIVGTAINFAIIASVLSSEPA